MASSPTFPFLTLMPDCMLLRTLFGNSLLISAIFPSNSLKSRSARSRTSFTGSLTSFGSSLLIFSNNSTTDFRVLETPPTRSDTSLTVSRTALETSSLIFTEMSSLNFVESISTISFLFLSKMPKKTNPSRIATSNPTITYSSMFYLLKITNFCSSTIWCVIFPFRK